MADASASLAVPGQQPHGPAPGGKNILFALDESEHSVAALNWAFDYLLRDGDKLTVAVVVDKEDVTAVTSRVKTLLRSVWQSNNVNCTMGVRVLVGAPHKAGELICKLVEELEVKPAMLVLGSAGKSHVQGFFVGSVSHYCVEHATIPVIVARCGDERGRNTSKGSTGSRRRSISPFFA
ncbi:hypothetical protein SpCBS45565_g06361 [Spizellomyces sp. 'palustris']|nr:hypothetical protein SpCBS45565_g06361 [Spizellomyces sp. 'palustris']